MHLLLSDSEKPQSNVPSTQEIKSKVTEFGSNVPNAKKSTTTNLPSQSPSNIDNAVGFGVVAPGSDMSQVAPETETAAAQPKRSSSGLCCQQVIK